MHTIRNFIDQYISTRFAQQGVRFYHAENIEGFRSHCESGQLHCRKAMLEMIPAQYTHFESDDYDQACGLDERVFGNIYDIGSIYARANLGSQNHAAPNVYGPLIFVFRPDVFSVMHDIVITQKSSWKSKPRWREGSITTEEQVEALLNAEWAKDNVADAWQYAEISCANTAIPLTHLEKIIVEPLKINISADPQVPDRYGLDTIAQQIAERCGISVPIEPRNFAEKPFKTQNLDMLVKLVEFCEQIPSTITQQNWNSASPALPQDFQGLSDKVKGRMRRWAQYFTFGTVRAKRR